MTRPGPATVLTRLLVVVGAVLVAVAAPPGPPFGTVLLALGTLATLALPGRVGAGPVLAGAAAVFLFAADRDPGTGAVLLAAAGVYLVHTATALAAGCPWDAQVSARVLGRWALRCLPAAALTAVAAGVDASVGTVPRTSGFAVAALVLALVAGGAVVVLLGGSRRVP